MAPRTMIDIIEEFNKEIKSIRRLQRASFDINEEFNRRIKSIRRLQKAKSKRIKSIQKSIKTRARKPIRATSIKFMEKNEVNDERKSKVLFKTTEGHDQLKFSRIPMEGVKLIPNASQEDFLPEKEQPPSSTTKPTLHSSISSENYEHDSRPGKKSSNFLRKMELYFLRSRLDSIMKRKSTPKLEITELLAFIETIQDINAAHTLPPEFLYKILSDLAEASDISEHTYFTNNSFPKIIAQNINKTL